MTLSESPSIAYISKYHSSTLCVYILSEYIIDGMPIHFKLAKMKRTPLTSIKYTNLHGDMATLISI